MLLDFFDDIAETFRSCNGLAILMVIPLVLLASPGYASQSFPVFRLQGFESGSNKNGSFGAAIAAEATTHIRLAHRKCFLMRMEETNAARLKDVVRMYPLAIVIILPDAEATLQLSEEQQQNWLEVESMLLEGEYPIPIYFALQSETVMQVLSDLKEITSTDSGSSAAKALVNAIFGNGFQIVASSPAPAQIPVTKFANIMASLINTRKNVELDSLMIVAHYDAFSPSADLSKEVDASGTGAACLLSLAKTLSGLYGSPENQPSLNVNFLLSAAGKVNFLGSNHYLQNNEQASKKMRLVLALDSLNGLEADSDTLYFHRKTAKSTSNAQLQDLLRFQQILEQTATDAGLKFEVVFRRPNADQWFQWEHERYSGYRAATISGHSNPYHPMRKSLLDNGQKINSRKLITKMEVVQKAVLQYLYNVSQVLHEEDQKNYYQQYQGLVSEEEVETLMHYVATQPHSSQYLGKGHPYVRSLYRSLSRYGKLAAIHEFSLDFSPSSAGAASVRKEDVVFYDQKQAIAFAYKVKPAVFDLFLSVAIAAYVGLVYLSVLSVPMLHSYLQSKLLFPQQSSPKQKAK